MGDRRNGDRRSPEKGVVRIPFKDAVLYISFTAIVLVLLVITIVSVRKTKQYEELYLNLQGDYEQLEDRYEEIMNEEYEE